jgi:hypothetical protein
MRERTLAYPAGLVVALLLTAPLQAQTTWHVDDDAAAGGDGTTWSTAYKYLQDALAVATAGDEIRVAQGTYKPDQDEGGNVTPDDLATTYAAGCVASLTTLPYAVALRWE